MSANRLKLNADKTELLFASSSYSCATLSGRYPVLQLGADTAVASGHVRLLGVIYLVIYLVWPHQYELVQPMG